MDGTFDATNIFSFRHFAMDSVLAHPFATTLKQHQLKFESASLPITISLVIFVIFAIRVIVNVSPHELLWR